MLDHREGSVLCENLLNDFLIGTCEQEMVVSKTGKKRPLPGVEEQPYTEHDFCGLHFLIHKMERMMSVLLTWEAPSKGQME